MAGRITVTITFFLGVVILYGAAEQRSAKNDQRDINSLAELTEFLVAFTDHFKWRRTLLLTNDNATELFRQFSIKFEPTVISSIDAGLLNLIYFNSVNIISDQYTAFDILTEMLATPLKSPQNWLIISDQRLINLNPLFIPHEFRVVFAEKLKSKTIKLFRIYSTESDNLKTTYLGRWRADTNDLRIRHVSIPLPMLSGKHFRITSVKFKPHFTPKNLKPALGRKPKGIYGEILDTLRKRMNFTFSVSEPEDGLFGIAPNNTYSTGMVRRLIHNESDIIVAICMTTNRQQAIDYSHIVSQIVVTFVYRDDHTPHRWTFFYDKPFPPFLWSTIAIMSIIIALTLAIINTRNYFKLIRPKHKLSKQNKKKVCWVISKTFTQSMETTFHALMRNGPGIDVSCTPGRIVFQVFHFFSLMIYIHYTSILTSLVTVNTQTVLFKSLDDVLDNPDYDLGTLLGTSVEEMFSTATVDVYPRAWKKMNKNRDRFLTKTMKAGLDMAYESNFVYILDRDALTLAVRRNCAFHFAEIPIYVIPFNFAYRKGFQYTRTFNKYLQMLLEGGVVTRIVRKLSPPNHNLYCQTRNHHIGFKTNTNFILVILAAVVAITFVALTIEVYLDTLFVH